MFCKLATRLTAYQGVMREHERRRQREARGGSEPDSEPALPAASRAAPPASAPRLTPSGQAPPPLQGGIPGAYQQDGKTIVPGTKQAIQADPELSKLFSFGGG